MKTRIDSRYGYVELNPDFNDYYDEETGEAIYEPSRYPYDIPKVYLEGSWPHLDTIQQDSVIMVRDNIVTVYNHYDKDCEKYNIEVYNLDTLEKKTYEVTPCSSRMNMQDYFRIANYVDPNFIKKINDNKDIPILPNKIFPLDE